MLPILSTAAATGKVAGRGALGAVTDTAKSAFIDPFKSAIAQTGIGQAANVVKDIRSEAASMRGDKAAGVDTSKMENELESIDNSNDEQITILENLLEAINFSNQLFQDQMTQAASARALKNRESREAAIESAAQQDAVEPVEGGDEGKPKGKGLFGDMLGKLKKAAFFLAIPALIAFFNSDTFTKLREFVADKWPVVKEKIANVFGALSLFFEDIMNIFTNIFDPSKTVGEKLEAALDLPKAFFDLFRRISDQIVSLFGNLIGADFGEQPVTEFINSVTDTITNIFDKVVNFITSLPNKIGELVDSLVEKIPAPLRKLMGVKTSSEIKAEGAEQRFEADSKSALTVDEQRQLAASESALPVDEQRQSGASNLDKGPTVAQQQLEKMDDVVPDLGINVEQLSNRDQRKYNKAVDMLKQGRIDKAEFEQKVSQFVPATVTGTTGQIADESTAANEAAASQPVQVFNDNRTFTSDNSRQTFAAAGASKAPKGFGTF